MNKSEQLRFTDMITLRIDTTKIKTAEIMLIKDGETYTKIGRSTLATIDALLGEHHVNISDIARIDLATGPGSFTGLKIGATIAGVLSLLLSIPINDNPPGIIPPLTYGEDSWGLENR